MAKQSGLHQIRGKVGEHSYYRQSGVSAGLIRSINQGMSSRVKTSDEYANTRLNNAEFGHACAIAGVLGRTVTPKFRPMMLTFSQSKMARVVLEAIKLQTGNWGQRSLPSGTTGRQALIDALISVRKNDPESCGVNVEVTPTSVTIAVDDTISVAFLSSIGADKLNFMVIRNSMQIGNYVPAFHAYMSNLRVANTLFTDVDVDSDTTLSISAPTLPVPPEGYAESFGLDVIVVMPTRTINNQDHILQEQCTYIIK